MSIIKEIGHFLKNNIKPELSPHKDPKHLESIVLGSSLVKSIGDALVKYHGKKKKGGAMYGSGKQEALEMIQKNIKKFSKGLPMKSGMGLSQNMIKKADLKKISAKDVFGEDWRVISRELVNKIKELHRQHEGGNIFKDIGHAFSSAGKKIKKGVEKGFEEVGKATKKVYKKAKQIRDDAVHELSEFAKGNTKLKPSALAGYIAGGLGIVAGIATLQPELIGVSAAVIGGVSAVAGGTATILKTSGRGLLKGHPKLPPLAKKFAQKHPDKAHEIVRILDMGHGGKGISKKGKNILKTVGVLGVTGALSFLGWAQNRNPNVIIPKIDHTIPDDAWLGMGEREDEYEGEGWNDIKNFLKKHKKKAIAILTGAVVLGSAVAGQSLFKQKYGGIAPSSSQGARIIKHLLSGSDKKLEVGNILLSGKKVIKMGKGVHLSGYGLKPAGGALRPAGSRKGYGLKPAGGALKLSKKVKKALKIAGALAIPSAVLFAKYISGRTSVDDDFGDISAEEHLLMFGQGGKPPKKVSQFAKEYPDKAKIIIKELQKNPGKGYQAKGYGYKASGVALAGYGKKRKKKIGSKKEVYEGMANRTSGGLLKCHLCVNKRGKVVSIKQMENGRKRMANLKRKR